MSDELVLFEFLEYDNDLSNVTRKDRPLIRKKTDPFNLEDADFIKRYRLSKQLVLHLCEELKPHFRKPTKSTDLSVETKILTALSFYATGSYQRAIGDIGAHSMAQQTVSSIISEVTKCIDTNEMRKKYISFPKNVEERNKTRTRFYQKFKFPGILGCIDCTHVAIIRPAKNEERYYCRKHYHSLNVQLICDADMQITSVDASYGGASHDSFIWNTHPIKSHLENLNETTWLLGDSAYPLRKYMMTPILNTLPDSPEKYYTDLHIKARNVIERTVGLLKARFRCLIVHRVLHYSPEVAASIVNVCVILHNICNKANIPVDALGHEDMVQESQMQQHMLHIDEMSNNQPLQSGVYCRNNLIHHLWNVRMT